MTKLITPKSVLIEKVALELAATWYEIGRGQGMTSKYPNAKKYAAANLEKFIPKAVEMCLKMLEPNSNATPEMKEEIYEALMERHDDPVLNTYMPNIDVKKVIALVEEAERNKGPVIIKTLDDGPPKTVLHNQSLPEKPIRAQRH